MQKPPHTGDTRYPVSVIDRQFKDMAGLVISYYVRLLRLALLAGEAVSSETF